MTLVRYLLWTIQAILWFAVLTGIQYPVRKRNRLSLRIAVLFIKALLGTCIAFAIMVSDQPILLRSGFSLAALYAVLLGDCAGDLVHLLFIRPDRKNSRKLRIVFGLVCAAAFFIYGTVNMQIVTANRFTVSSPKLRGETRAIFAADLHVGSSQSLRTTEETIRKIDAENADLVILGGDIVDIYTTKEEMEKTFELLGKIKAPVYYIFGNHDRQTDYEYALGRTFAPEELEADIRSNGIHILQDEWIQVSEDLVLFGREDYNAPSRKPVSEIPPRPEGCFVLLADHSPYETDDIIASGADLQLSGHTHAGQLFPLQWVYRLAGRDAYGFFRHGNTDLYVSSGASGWSFPFRTEAGCHYEVITLTPVGD